MSGSRRNHATLPRASEEVGEGTDRVRLRNGARPYRRHPSPTTSCRLASRAPMGPLSPGCVAARWSAPKPVRNQSPSARRIRPILWPVMILTTRGKRVPREAGSRDPEKTSARHGDRSSRYLRRHAALAERPRAFGFRTRSDPRISIRPSSASGLSERGSRSRGPRSRTIGRCPSRSAAGSDSRRTRDRSAS